MNNFMIGLMFVGYLFSANNKVLYFRELYFLCSHGILRFPNLCSSTALIMFDILSSESP